jgi:hypothetical protein
LRIISIKTSAIEQCTFFKAILESINGSNLIATSTAPNQELKTMRPSKIHLKGLRNSMRYYKPGIHLIINEMIKHFTGRTPEIINIPTKPT